MTPTDIAVLFANAIESIGGSYFIGGSVASTLYSEPRTTNDIDIVVRLHPRHAAALAERLGPAFEADVRMVEQALRDGVTSNIFYLPALTKLDLFTCGNSPYDEIEFERRQAIDVGNGRTLFVKSPEDSVLRKLWWFRQGGETSERQWRDVISLLRINANTLDAKHLQLWANVLSIADLLERAQASL